MACQVVFEPLPGQGEQFRCGGQVPVGGGRVDMAEVGGQQGQPGLPGGIGVEQAADREGVSLRSWIRGRQDGDRGCSPAWRASCWNVECTLQYISRVPAGEMNIAGALG